MQDLDNLTASWLAIRERQYAISCLSPLGTPRIRAIKKAKKHY